MRLAVAGVVLAVFAACVAEPGSSGVPAPSEPTARPARDVTPSPPGPSPSAAPADSGAVGPSPRPAPSPAGGATILAVDGQGSQRIGPFLADEDWAIAWRRLGSRLFSVQLIQANEDVFGELVVSTTELTAGTSPMHRSGAFVVQVHASEPWRVRIVDLLPTPVRSIPAELEGTGPTNTDLFAADEPFLVEWTADRAVPFGIELVTMTTGEPLLIVAAQHARAGCHQLSVADEFYLRIVTDASWTVSLQPSLGEIVCPAA